MWRSGVFLTYLTLTDSSRAGCGVNGLSDSVRAPSSANGALSLVYFALCGHRPIYTLTHSAVFYLSPVTVYHFLGLTVNN